MRKPVNTTNHKEFLTMMVRQSTNPGVARDIQAFLISMVEAVLTEEGPQSSIEIHNRLTPGTFRTGDSKKTVVGYQWDVDIKVKGGKDYDGICWVRVDDQDKFKRLYLEGNSTEWQEEKTASTTLQ